MPKCILPLEVYWDDKTLNRSITLIARAVDSLVGPKVSIPAQKSRKDFIAVPFLLYVRSN